MGTQSESDLTERELDLMERRSQAASPGPWISFVVGRDLEAGLNCIEVGYCALMEVLGGTEADQDFIASAREDVPRLVKEVRRLRAELKVRATPHAAGTTRPVAPSRETAPALAQPAPVTC